MMQFNGIYVPIITPFNDDESINYAGLAAVVEHVIAEGVDGIISGGTTGEYYAQSSDERIAHMRFVTERVAGRVTVIGGVGAIRTADAVALAEAARDIGVDALLVNSPSYCLPTQEELAGHALAIDRAADLPIMLYNYPARTGTPMDREFFQRVTDASENFVAIKESSGDINQLHLLACDFPQLQLSCGADDLALEFFAWGATSWVCAGANCLAREHIALFDACVRERDFAKGRRLMAAMLPFLTLLERGGKFIQSVKFGCEISGVPAGRPRLPLADLAASDQQLLREVIQTLRSNVDEIVSGNGAEAADSNA